MQKIAFVFPGQGSQSIGMLSELAAENPIIKETFAIASEVLQYDLWHLTQEGPEERLNQTSYAQPALLTAGVAVWKTWQQKSSTNMSTRDIAPAMLAGHSLGEYTALVCADAIDFKDAVQLVRDRGLLMQEAVPVGKGAMAAIVGLSDEKVAEICAQVKNQLSEILSPANYNSIGQIVLAGETTAINKAIELAKAAGAKIAKLLQVSVPSHCELMKPAAEKLKERLATVKINKPVIPVIHNALVHQCSDPNKIREALIKQLSNPVYWTQTIQLMQKENIKQIYECGPGKILTGLNKRIIDDSQIIIDFLGLPQKLEIALQKAST